MFQKPGGTLKLPPKDTPSGWLQVKDISQMGRSPSDTKLRMFDWAVIGGGFSGIAAAQRLGELNPKDSIVLIDAHPIGWGASGRNSGFIIDLPHKFDLESNDKSWLHAVMTLNAQALSNLKSTVQAHNIDCEWSQAGKLQAAITSRGESKMQIFISALDRLNQPYTLLNRHELTRVIGTTYYSAAVHTPGCVLMNPVKLVRGLAASLPKNVTIFDNAPVVRFVKNGVGRRITLRIQGCTKDISVSRTLLCTNAFTPQFGFLKNRIVPIMTFASMTHPLSDSEMAAYGGQLDWGLTPADSGGTTLRMTQDKRILIRNQYDYAKHYGKQDHELDQIRAKHREAFLLRYPQLKDVSFESSWGGVLGLSRNHVSYFGKVSADVWNTSCHNGVGVARGSISGRLLAEAACEHESNLLDMMRKVSQRPSLNPPDPFLGIGVKMRLKYDSWKSRKEI